MYRRGQNQMGKTKTEDVVRGGCHAGSSVSPKTSPQSILELNSEINRLTNSIHSTHQAFRGKNKTMLTVVQHILLLYLACLRTRFCALLFFHKKNCLFKTLSSFPRRLLLKQEDTNAIYCIM